MLVCFCYVLIAVVSANSYETNGFLDIRIVGGSEAPDHVFPHQISIQIPKLGHICSGSIVTKKCILTAAHCVYRMDPGIMTVVAGTSTLSSGGTRYAVNQAIHHEAYDTFLKTNDVAVLKLSQELVFDEKIQRISLSKVHPSPQTQCTLTGWGYTSTSSNELPDNLQQINLTTISVEQCRKVLPSNSRPITYNQTCTLAPVGQGACVRDSGAALINNANRELVGVVSWGYPCGLGKPDVFTTVYGYKDWIEEKCKEPKYYFISK
ncbi:hypothetical protein RI129_012975 [Pyrocoelia pectoralis]|uniref:Peptidase S1 domain-containing protein n=1 Tax=Pyrocoelia pectoralis TaxID=417401 RepID=A0AAN7UV26_9COLE